MLNDGALPKSKSTPSSQGEVSSPTTSISAPLETLDELNPASDTTQIGNPVLLCTCCKKKFRTLIQLKLVKGTITLWRYSTYPLCSKHVRRHDRPHRCPHDMCEKNFRDRTDLKRHMNNVHQVSVQEFSCLVKGCTKTFKGRRDNMYKHVRREHPDRVQLISRRADLVGEFAVS